MGEIIFDAMSDLFFPLERWTDADLVIEEWEWGLGYYRPKSCGKGTPGKRTPLNCWCCSSSNPGHCKKLFPEFTKASIELKGHDPAIK